MIAPFVRHRAGAALCAALHGFGGSPLLASQDPGEAAGRALRECVAAAQAGNEAGARAAADRAGALYRELGAVPGREADALTGQGSVLSQCRIPFAGFMRQGELVMESIELAQRALAIDSLHLDARFLLAMNFRRMPAFLGRAQDAEREFARIIELHRERAGSDLVRMAHVHLGDMQLQDGRTAEALRTWRRGLDHWPEDPELRERIATHGGSGTDSPPVAPDEAREHSAASGARYVLEPIVVEAGSVSMEEPRSATRLSRIEVYTAPGGAADVLQVFQTMPGVTRVADGSDLYVRGGDPAESPVFLDGARLFYAGMFESLDGSVFGVLDPAVLRRAYFSTGAFSVRYGNALSGVLDVETDGRPPVLSWRAGANLATLGGTLRLPTGRRGGVWSSLSGTDASALIRMQGREDEYASAPRAARGIFGASFHPSQYIEVSATGLLEQDRVEVLADANGWHGPFRGTGGSRLAALSISATSSDARTALRASLSWSERASGFGFGVLDRDRTDRYTGVRAEGDHAVHGRLTLRAGLEASRLAFAEDGTVPETEAVAPGSPSRQVAESRDTHHLGAFVESEWRLLPKLALVTGLRADQLPGEPGWTADPRAALAWRAGDWTLRAGTGLFHQGRWRVRYRLPDAGSPSGVPTEARHYVLGVQREASLALRAEAWRKEWTDYVADGRGPPTSGGRATGLDVLVRWKGDRDQGWLTWSWLDGTVELADGRSVPAATAVVHSVTAVERRQLGDRWEIGTTMRYATGRPHTPIVGRTENGSPQVGDIHSERLPHYLRLDTRLTRLQPAGDGIWVFYLEGLNLLDRRNVMGYVWDAEYGARRAVHTFFSHRTLILGVEAQF